MPTLNERLNEAIEAYATVAGLKASDFWDQRIVAELNESRDLDPTGITTFMMLHGLLDGFFADTSFTAKEILGDFDRFMSAVTSMRAVAVHMMHPEVLVEIEGFTADSRRMAASLGASEVSDLDKALTASSLGFIRRDALKSIKTLKAVQFTHGRPDSEPAQANARIFEFWNVNSLLRLLQQQPVSGATLCLIRDPEEVMASYFVFAVKHGDGITILTDREPGAHPAYYRMSRRPDRALARRAARHRFPYQLLDLEPTLSSQGAPNGLEAKSRTAVVRQQMEMAPIGTLADLPADQMLWAGMVLTHIADEYGRQNRQLAETTYTGEMVAVPESLVSSQSLVHQRGHELLTMSPLTAADVTAESTASQWERPATGHNEWLIGRHGHMVPDDALNMVGQPALKKLMASHAELLTVSPVDGFERKPEPLELETLDPTAFGSKADVERDRVWVARMNQCRIVQRVAKDEYERTYKEVFLWYANRMRQRIPFFLEAAARGEMVLPSVTYEPWGSTPVRQNANALRQVAARTHADLAALDRHYAIALGRQDFKAPLGYKCAVNTAVSASVFSVISPDCPETLARLAGLPVAELPEPLQHWYKNEPYTGNQILDRIDPSDWVLRNPWRKMVLKVLLPLSKTAYNAERKRLELPKRTSWS